MLSSFTRYFIGLAIVACMVSCNEGEVYYKFSPILDNEWGKDQEVSFQLDSLSINSQDNYAISLELVHNIDYQYKNLFLYLEHNHQGGISFSDTVECVLVDDHGRWYGSGNGATRQLSVLYKTNLRINPAMHNEISVRHAMQDLKLKGIEKIGLKVY